MEAASGGFQPDSESCCCRLGKTDSSRALGTGNAGCIIAFAKASIRALTLPPNSFVGSVNLARFGTLNWMDAPYHRMFSFGEIHFSPLGPTEGLATTIMLVDSSDGTLVAQKLYGMDHDVSVRLIDAIEHQQPMPNYDEVLQRTFAMYRTTDLVKMAQQE